MSVTPPRPSSRPTPRASPGALADIGLNRLMSPASRHTSMTGYDESSEGMTPPPRMQAAADPPRRRRRSVGKQLSSVLSITRSLSSFTRSTKLPGAYSKRRGSSPALQAGRPLLSYKSQAVQHIDFKTESLHPSPANGSRIRRIDSIRRRSWRAANYALNPDLHTPDDPGKQNKAAAHAWSESATSADASSVDTSPPSPGAAEQPTSPDCATTQSDSTSGEGSISPHPAMADVTADLDADTDCITERPFVPPPGSIGWLSAGALNDAIASAPALAPPPAVASPAVASPVELKREFSTSPSTRNRTQPTKTRPPKHYVPVEPEGEAASESPRRSRYDDVDAIEDPPEVGRQIELPKKARVVEITTGALSICNGHKIPRPDTKSKTLKPRGAPYPRTRRSVSPLVVLLALVMAAVLLASVSSPSPHTEHMISQRGWRGRRQRPRPPHPTRLQRGRQSTEKPTPKVQLVHGGLWVRDVWGYSAAAQWVVSRGQTTHLPVSSRGSSIGQSKKAVLRKGGKEWGVGSSMRQLLRAVPYTVRVLSGAMAHLLV